MASPVPAKCPVQLRRKNCAVFKKRAECILRKAHELSVLCDIMVCAVIVGPNGKIESRPENPNEAINLLKQFKAGNAELKEEKAKRRVRQVDLKKKIDFSLFDDELLNGLSQKSILDITKALKSKILAARNRVEFLKSKKTVKDGKSDSQGFEIIQSPPSFYQQPFSGMMFDDYPDGNHVEFLNKTGKDEKSDSQGENNGFEIIQTPSFYQPFSGMMFDDYHAGNHVEFLNKTCEDQESWIGSAGFDTTFDYSEMLSYQPPQTCEDWIGAGFNYSSCYQPQACQEMNFHWLGNGMNSLPPLPESIVLPLEFSGYYEIV